MNHDNAPTAKAVVKTLILALVLGMPAILPASEGPADDQGFVSLFNGRDLTGWITGADNAWVVEDGVITLKREMDGREHNLDYLWTKETYRNFILELEFKVPERANSGVFLRTPDLEDPVYTGIEVQVSNSHGRENLSRGGTAGAIYDCVAPTANAIKKPGEWNRYRITCNENRITVVLNGEEVVDMDLDRWTTPHLNPDGTKNKFPTALKDFSREGHVGLQDHGRPVWYRNVRIKRLAAAPKPPAGKPNFVFFLVDDLGYMDIGANNPNTFYETPNVDRLAREGMRFTAGYAANPVCSPTRYSIMTGKHPSRVDATNYFSGRRAGRFLPAPLNDVMALSEVTLAEALKAAGYRTAFLGKWHLGPTEQYWPEAQGFDVNVAGHNRGMPPSYFSPYRNPRLPDGPRGEHLTARLTDESLDIIERFRDNPFLLYLRLRRRRI
ncbi:MAG: family 16 glycoside hydrolase [Planctomycetota bacterium]|jgi:hypothetical protein